MNIQIKESPWQSYNIFDAAEQWGFDAKTARNRVLGEGFCVKRSFFHRYFVAQDGYSYSIYAINAFKKPSKILERVLWPYELGVKLNHLLKK